MSGGIVWFRQDLRLRDNPALHAAAMQHDWIVPVFIWSPEEEGEWSPGAASRWWLHHSLRSLDASLRKRGSRLVLARGRALEVLERLVSKTRATSVYWNHRYEPAARQCSDTVYAALRELKIDVKTFNASLLVEPDAIRNQIGKPYRVYSAYRRRLLRDVRPALPVPIPKHLEAPPRWPASLSTGSLKLLPKIKWYARMERAWQPGEAGAHTRMKVFLKRGLAQYRQARELPSERGTSRLSPHLHFGEISPRQIWHALGQKGRSGQFMSELIWREFAYYLLFHFPHTTTQPLREEFNHFPWRRNSRALLAWQLGRTGISLIDAGMRELWSDGWMHNRVRMVTASFLVKNLLIPWQDGARWFWDTLVDADLANNTLNWQWVAGSGADAAPYFRIFNPITQAKRFDLHEVYIRRWAGSSGAKQIIDLRKSRDAALDAYATMRINKKAGPA